MNDLLKAGIGIATIIGVFFFGSLFGEGVKPVEKANDAVNQPASYCHAGWQDTSSKDEHGLVLSCTKDKWMVILHPGGAFNYGLELDRPGAQFVFDERQVPGW